MKVIPGVFAIIVALTSVGVRDVNASSWWQPSGKLSWQVQFTGRIETSIRADVYDIDAFESSASVVARLHKLGRRVACYIDAGSWEKFRPDADRYPASVKGMPLDGWPDERWLDIRRLDILGPILESRVAMCAAKGFDAVDFDNVDGYSNRTGFPLNADDQRVFNRWLADTAHAHGLGVGLKNTPTLAGELEPSFDFSVVEQCVQYRECASYAPFLDAAKPVLDIEYSIKPATFCASPAAMGMFVMRKRLALDAWRRTC